MSSLKKSWLKPAILLPLAFAVQSAMAINIVPDDDGFARGGKHAHKDFASKNTLVVKNSHNISFDRKSYLTFDLSSVDLESLDRVSLKLYAKKIKKTITLNVMQTQNSWSGKLNWNTAPGANPGAGVARLSLKPQTNKWVEVDITELAKSTKGNTLSLVIENPQAGSGNGATFRSLESSDAPQLVVTNKTATAPVVIIEPEQTAPVPEPGNEVVIVPTPDTAIPVVTLPTGNAGGTPDTDTGDAFDPGLPVVDKPADDNGSNPVVGSGVISGNITGLSVDRAVITASGRGELHTVLVDGDSFRFNNLNPDIEYTIKVQAKGLRLKGLITTTPDRDQLSLLMQPMPNLISDDTFHFIWNGEGENVSGLEYASAVNKPIKVTIHGVEKEVPSIAAAQMLFRDFGIVLDDSGDLPWTQDHAYRLLETFRQVPQRHCYNGPNVGIGLRCKGKDVDNTVWKLSTRDLHNDIQIDNENITLGIDTFTYANPAIATVDGRKGRFFSKRLHHAVVRKITNNGNDLKMANFILENRFGVTIDTRKNTPWSNLSKVYRDVAVTGVDRDSSAWQSFAPEEILIVINQFEEMPTGMHMIRAGKNNEKGLKYLFRRKNGHDHPLYPGAPAVAWPGAGYIEFMEIAFKGDNLEHMQRLVLHEKSHFLWHYRITEAQKEEWYKFSDWYRLDSKEMEHYYDLPYDPSGGEDGTHRSGFNPATLNAHVYEKDGWSARKTTNFVSAYAQLKNPNEDMAESISYFLLNPDKLRSRAPGKYEFIKERLMAGVMYLQEIRDDLTFEVLNLHPDYIYPGKIKSVEIKVEGQAGDNKRVTVDLELHTTKENCSSDSCMEGASKGYTRLYSEAGTIIDMNFFPVDGGKLSHKLRGTVTIPNTAKNGWWAPAQIKLRDEVGNERYQRNTDYGWQLFVNNPAEDTDAPRYMDNSLTVDLSDPKPVEIKNGDFSRTLNQDNCEGYSSKSAQCRMVRTLTAHWDVDEDVKMGNWPCFTRTKSDDYRDYSRDKYGSFTKNVDGVIDGQCETSVFTTEYYRTGEYEVAFLSMSDQALNRGGAQFADDHNTYEASPKVLIDNSNANPDTRGPEANIQACSSGDDEQCIHVEATPANAEKPDGETNVVLTFWARDDKSGLDSANYILRDPQGKQHSYRVDHNNTHTLFFNGEPTTWKKYVGKATLPKGSAPGTWGVSEMTLHDKAGNKTAYDFTETVIFEPFEVE